MFAKLKFTLCLSVLSVVVAASTGCMTSHGNGQHVGSKSKTQSFNGWTTVANQDVEIYALQSFNNWVKIGETQAGSSAYNYWGVNWYFWYISAKVPNSCWHAISGPGAQGDYMAVIKVVDGNGNSLYYFEPGFYQWFDEYNDFGTMWSEKGVSTEAITLFADD